MLKLAENMEPGDVFAWQGTEYVTLSSVTHAKSPTTVLTCVMEARAAHPPAAIFALELLRGRPLHTSRRLPFTCSHKGEG